MLKTIVKKNIPQTEKQIKAKTNIRAGLPACECYVSINPDVMGTYTMTPFGYMCRMDTCKKPS